MNKLNKLNLGCGDDIRKGYINMDVRKRKGVNLVGDITKRLPFENESCDEVIAQDVLEHLISQDQEKLLCEICRILVKNGGVFIRMPNIDIIWERMADDLETRNLFLYGETNEQGIWGAHKTGHTLLSAGTLFRSCGFKTMSVITENTNWIFELKKEEMKNIEVLVTNSPKSILLNFNRRPVVMKIYKKIDNYFIFRLLKYFVDEYWVPNKNVYKSLFPKTRVPMSRVQIDELNYQVKRSFARKMAKNDLGI